MTAIIADQHCASWSVQDLLLQLSCGHAEIPAAPRAGSQPASLRRPLRRWLGAGGHLCSFRCATALRVARWRLCADRQAAALGEASARCGRLLVLPRGLLIAQAYHSAECSVLSYAQRSGDAKDRP